jgi:hypothetical protein
LIGLESLTGEDCRDVIVSFQKSRWLLLFLLRKKPCPEFLLTHVNPAAREMHRK